jgi:hypothetical protein
LNVDAIDAPGGERAEGHSQENPLNCCCQSGAQPLND